MKRPHHFIAEVLMTWFVTIVTTLLSAIFLLPQLNETALPLLPFIFIVLPLVLGGIWTLMLWVEYS